MAKVMKISSLGTPEELSSSNNADNIRSDFAALVLSETRMAILPRA
ncbi:MAG: hypothetical protein QME54_01565 [Actinomycetota bacterium]|nr:hypothetical protein [Actinomycetota bacterium]